MAKEIPLTQGKVALVDDADYDWLMQWKWHAVKQRNTYCAYRTVGSGKNAVSKIMHREILGVTDHKIFVDHEDHNTLNNQRYNIRICTPSQNNKNKSSHCGSTSKYIGVSWNKRLNKWLTQIQCDGKKVHIGVYISEVEAARAYNGIAIKYFGEYANLNVIDGSVVRPSTNAQDDSSP